MMKNSCIKSLIVHVKLYFFFFKLISIIKCDRMREIEGEKKLKSFLFYMHFKPKYVFVIMNLFAEFRRFEILMVSYFVHFFFFGLKQHTPNGMPVIYFVSTFNDWLDECFGQRFIVTMQINWNDSIWWEIKNFSRQEWNFLFFSSSSLNVTVCI